MADLIEELIPDMSNWNDGKGVHPRMWLQCMGNYELAIGYSQIFWPQFERFESYVLQPGFSLEMLRGYEKFFGGDRTKIEAEMNSVELYDLHSTTSPNEAQLRFLGQVLKDCWDAKLNRDFPDMRFVVSFGEKPGAWRRRVRTDLLPS